MEVKRPTTLPVNKAQTTDQKVPAIQPAASLYGFDEDTVRYLRANLATGLTDTEFKAFLLIAQRKKLDPIQKHIYAIKRGGKMVIQVSIDGLRSVAARSGLYAGSDEKPIYAEDGTLKAVEATVWRLARPTSDTRYAFNAIASMDEYKPKDNDFMWKKMGFRMLAKCAEALALRKAFPEDLGGLYTTEEMDQANDGGTEEITD